jgi:hypothetical protein
MKLITIGVGGSGASCIECVVHIAALGLLPSGVELIPVILDPDQDHPRIQSTSHFIAAYSSLREKGGLTDRSAGGLLGTKIARVVNTNTLRPSTKRNLFSLLGLAQPVARSLATLFFTEQEMGRAGSSEFGHGYYGRVNAGVCFFNDPEGRARLMEALHVHVLGGDAAIILVGSAFGGTGAAGLIHLARVFKDDPGLRHIPFRLAAVQLEPYFRPDRRGDFSDHEIVNVPATFSGRTGAALHFMSGLAADDNLPFDAFYPLGVSTPSAFPPEWFKKDRQNNPHLFVEYLSALAVRDFALNHADLRGVLRHRREAVPPFEGPLAVLREGLHDALSLRILITSYVLPLLEIAGPTGRLPGHPWVAEVCSVSGLTVAELAAHFAGVASLLQDILIAAGIDRQGALSRAGGAAEDIAAAERRVELTRASFPPQFSPDAGNCRLVDSLEHADAETLFSTYGLGDDARLPARALMRWVAAALHPERGTPTIPAIARHVGEPRHQWTQQGTADQVLGIAVPPDDRFQSDDLAPNLLLLASAPWRESSNAEPHAAATAPRTPKQPPARTAGEYPSIWAPALVHRDELYRDDASHERRYLHLGLLACALLRKKGLATPPVRSIDPEELEEAFQLSLKSSFPLPGGHAAMVAPGGVLAIYESAAPLGAGAVPSPEDLVGFFYPDTVVVPAAGITAVKQDYVIGLGELVAGRGFPQMLHTLLGPSWLGTLIRSGVPGAGDKASQFLTFLASFKDPIVDRALDPKDRYAASSVPNAAGWVLRLYQ